MQNIAIFMDNPNENEIIALAEKIGLSSGDLNKYPTELSGRNGKNAWHFCVYYYAAVI